MNSFFARANLLGFIVSFLASAVAGAGFMDGLYMNRPIDTVPFVLSLSLPLLYALASAAVCWLFRGGFAFYLPFKPSRGRGGAAILAAIPAIASLYMEFVRVETRGISVQEAHNVSTAAFGVLSGCFFLWFVSYLFFHWVYQKMAGRSIVG